MGLGRRRAPTEGQTQCHYPIAECCNGDCEASHNRPRSSGDSGRNKPPVLSSRRKIRPGAFGSQGVATGSNRPSGRGVCLFLCCPLFIPRSGPMWEAKPTTLARQGFFPYGCARVTPGFLESWFWILASRVVQGGTSDIYSRWAQTVGKSGTERRAFAVKQIAFPNSAVSGGGVAPGRVGPPGWGWCGVLAVGVPAPCPPGCGPHRPRAPPGAVGGWVVAVVPAATMRARAGRRGGGTGPHRRLTSGTGGRS